MQGITVRVFASHPVAAAQYARLLAAESDLRLVSGDEPFDVGVFDASTDSLEALLTLTRQKLPSMRPVLLSHPCDEEQCLRWLWRGIWGWVAYETWEGDVARAVRQVAAGELWFPPAVVGRWMQMNTGRSRPEWGASLTAREREVLELVARRLSNKEIAALLRLRETTVKFHVGNIFRKLQISSREELAQQWAKVSGAL